MAKGKNGLPRLGTDEARRPDPATQVVAIPGRGATVVLRKPSVGTMLELDARDTSEESGFDEAIALITRMLVEPELSEKELREEVLTWDIADWTGLQDAAMKLAGVRKEDADAARDEFRSAAKS